MSSATIVANLTFNQSREEAPSMAVSLGKRKRSGRKEEQDSSSEDEQDLRARFQQAFEAKFRPLEKEPDPPKVEATEPDEDDEDSEDSDWSGFSEDGDAVQVIAHKKADDSFPEMDRSEQRAYMSSKPPAADERKTPTKAPSKGAGEDDASEAANLKHDLALQRLLKESHLLDPSTFSAKNSAPEGKGRLKALDLRLQDLGAKNSLSAQDKMPIAHRQGIKSKAVGREEKRRKDAAENGVVLERARHAAKDLKRRERSVGGPTVGKFRGGTLQLSGRDLRDIQGPKTRGKGKKGRR